MKKRFSEAQIIGFLRESEAGLPVKDLCRRHGFSEASYCTSSDQSGPLGLLQKRHVRLLCRVMRRSEILSPPCG